MNKFPLDIAKRFAILITLLLLAMDLFSQIFFSQQTRRALELRLAEKARFLNGTYALFLADALAHKDDIALMQLINFLEQDPEISSVIVVDQRDQIRYHAKAEKVGTALDDAWVKQALQTGSSVLTPILNEGGKALALVSPLKTPGLAQPIGATRIELTYRWVDQQARNFRSNFWLFVAPGSVLFSVGIVMAFFWRRVTAPLKGLRQSLSTLNPTEWDARYPEGSDEFGQLGAALNELLMRFRMEWQRVQSATASRGEQEIQWADRLAHALLPEARLIMADKDNRILRDSGDGVSPVEAKTHHLLDLIADSNFATLLDAAYRKEGEAAHGQVRMQDKTYEAAVLSVPANQSVLVKTLIALKTG